ncbi:hypothetical protein [Chitinivorax sp. B]|uniref:hypothetical protein n=1 Tax=Chitinivorax sp. B TaxID=2502235 RepID=UPI0010F732C0|nr:hypothetical protein [Chitinivorax sp. B]
MHKIDLGPVQFVEGLQYSFPDHLCANCGTTLAVSVQIQETRRATYMLLGGTELTFKLPIPTCEQCAPALKRRPLSLINKIFIALLVSLALATVVLLTVTLGDVSMPVSDSVLLGMSPVLGFGLTAAYFMLHRVRAPQTSYYQPVRIEQVKRAFVDSTIQKIGFAFTNDAYGRAFAQQNKAAIQAKLISARKA